MGALTNKQPTIKDFQNWVLESTETHNIWHRESWEDCAFKDGNHWKPWDKKLLISRGINPITANRVFPVVNLLTGYQAQNPVDVVAKGRTQADSEISQVMSEALKFVMDQCDGESLIREAYEDQIVPGYGYLRVGTIDDPRREAVHVSKAPWYTFGWDRYGSPWLDPLSCRYCYYYPWVDLDDLIAVFPEHKIDLENEFKRMCGETARTRTGISTTYSIADEVESYLGQMTGGAWADSLRRRVKPVELYYAINKSLLFAVMENGAVYEVADNLPVQEQFDMLRRSVRSIKATVKKIRRAQFLGEVLLEDIDSPHPHDRYPFAPFIGYLDRFRLPFGVPRQIKEQAMEVNKRRSMALALLHAKRMIVEKGAVEDPMVAFNEMNSLLGLIEVDEGKIDKIKIEDLSDMAASQVELMHIAEREVQEIAGANDESLGYDTKQQSGYALERKEQRTGVMTASLAKNYDRSTTILGNLVLAEIQKEWTGQKVLRVTDRITGADRFVQINEPITNAKGQVIEVRNCIYNGLFDSVIAKKPLSDTQREQNVELLFTAIQKSPPEAIPTILSMAFELSDMPQKEALLAQLRTVLGVEPIDPLLSKDEQDAKLRRQQESIEAKSNADAQYEQAERELSLAEREAKIEKQRAEVEAMMIELKQKEREQASKEFQEGFRLQQGAMRQRESGVPVENR